MTPTTGFFKRSESENRAPIFLPPRILNESERKEREHMKKYRQVRRDMRRIDVKAISRRALLFG